VKDMAEASDRASLPEEVDELFAAQLDAFTSARDEVAGALKEQGRSDDAKRVKALKKPTLGAWAVNQVARRHHHDLAELLDVTDRIKDAGTPQEVRAAVAERHRLARDLVDAAQKILEESGHSAGAGTLQQVMRTLYAAHSGEERERIARGTLERPLESSGFDVAPGLSLESPEEPSPDEKSDERARLEEELAEAKERATRLEREAAKARLEADAAESEAAEARRLLTGIEEKLGRTTS
jgi:hypothetical protein